MIHQGDIEEGQEVQEEKVEERHQDQKQEVQVNVIFLQDQMLEEIQMKSKDQLELI